MKNVQQEKKKKKTAQNTGSNFTTLSASHRLLRLGLKTNKNMFSRLEILQGFPIHAIGLPHGPGLVYGWAMGSGEGTGAQASGCCRIHGPWGACPGQP